ncbi:MAG: hypothetical protein JXB13_19435 [Phycisphaerae bacterium]|nr:hypothetical protein [Phycisphaerae bacterium]
MPLDIRQRFAIAFANARSVIHTEEGWLDYEISDNELRTVVRKLYGIDMSKGAFSVRQPTPEAEGRE